MTIPPESIQVGKCYLFPGDLVRRVVAITPDGRVDYEVRGPRPLKGWRARSANLASFAAGAIMVIECDYEPGSHG